MNTANSSPDNKRYNAEVNLLDGLYEFHPEFLNDLSSRERQVMRSYYLTGAKDVPNNIFDYRLDLIKEMPNIEQQAQAVLAKLLSLVGINDFYNNL